VIINLAWEAVENEDVASKANFPSGFKITGRVFGAEANSNYKNGTTQTITVYVSVKGDKIRCNINNDSYKILTKIGDDGNIPSGAKKLADEWKNTTYSASIDFHFEDEVEWDNPSNVITFNGASTSFLVFNISWKAINNNDSTSMGDYPSGYEIKGRVLVSSDPSTLDKIVKINVFYHKNDASKILCRYIIDGTASTFVEFDKGSK